MLKDVLYYNHSKGNTPIKKGKCEMFASIFTIIFGAVCIVLLFNEDKLIAFEDKIIERIKNRK